MDQESIRLQKLLSERGVCSRRGATTVLNAGRVTVNGTPVSEPGLRIQPGKDTVCVDGMPLAAGKTTHRTIVLHKPRGYICSQSASQGKTIYELLPADLQNLQTAGRLDKDSEGLVVLSDDGELILRLTHPRHGHTKTYRVTVSGTVDGQTLAFLRSAMLIEGYRIRPVNVTYLGPGSMEGRTILRFILKEGRNRQIRNMCAQARLQIHRLVREKSGPYHITGLKPGEWKAV